MEELMFMLGLMAAAGVLAFAFSAALARRPKKAASNPLSSGMLVRLKTPDAVYRVRYVATRGNAIVLGAPISRDRFVPIRPGEKVTVEAPTKQGVYIFRSEVVGRDVESHEVHLQMPEVMHLEDRRQVKRILSTHRTAQIEDTPAEISDLASQGVCVTTDRPLRQGDRIRVDLDGQEPAFAWVLDCAPNTGPGKGKHRVRARFEQELSL